MNLSPDWVITGAPHARGVKVTASKNVKGGSVVPVQRSAEATGVVKAVADASGVSANLYQHDHYRITVLAEDLVEAVGPDYPSALRMLFAIWQVPDAPTPVSALLAGESAPSEIQAVLDEANALVEFEGEMGMSDEERSIAEQITSEEP